MIDRLGSTFRHTERSVLKPSLLLALVVLASPASAADAAPTPKGQGPCKATSEPQTRKLDFRYLFQETLQKKGKRKDGSDWPVKVVREERGSLGTMTFRATTCKAPKTGWKLLGQQGLSFTSSGRTDQGGVDNGEWKIGLADAREGATSFISMRMMSCSKTGLFKGIRLVVGAIPLTKLPFAKGIVNWGLGKVLPDDKVKCGDYGTVDVGFSPEADGDIVAVPSLVNVKPNSYIRPDKHFTHAYTYSITAPEIAY